ncbi:cystine-binding periplasmic protein precursor [Clostridium acetireducens DSM 10703]|jgi:polar amino acid transport system substrate-binding protein|uniref:Cystine-binding periplasmic protein n=1 Tax=Clostridium acetireducens DSM 10703 TaxID=1121290 RepID=A0A1E8EWE2_9CLOT|nr:ABC transporter substrate-binding protein [Clostridium acetireducens]OFI01564.1 cystine-binding periplasmic protein precursor [Clostridium acetireducens DSM 10703]
MKKLLSMVLSFVFVCALFIGCGGSQKNEEAKNSLERVKNAKKLTVGLEDTYPPMEFRDNKNELIGFDIDIANAIGKKMGVDVEIVPTEFSGLLMALNAGKFDISISAISINDERKKAVDFSKPYAKGGQVVIVKKGDTAVKSVKDLKGKTVGCQLGTTGEEAAKKVEGLKELKTYDKATAPFHDLEIGRLDAVVADEFVGRYYLSKEKDKYDVVDSINEEPIAIAFKKGDKELQEEVQKTIDELEKDGTLSKISMKWFGTDIYKK